MDILRRLTGASDTTCEHIPAERAAPSGARCEECGSTFNLRLCATCGHVGCCESQAGHARAHALRCATRERGPGDARPERDLAKPNPEQRRDRARS